MTVEEACEFFQAVPFIYRKVKVLQEVGLGYITLGQSAVTLSGGEAQRIKLATESLGPNHRGVLAKPISISGPFLIKSKRPPRIFFRAAR